VTYYNSIKVVRYPSSLANMYKQSLALDMVVRSREQERGYRSLVLAFKMRMLLKEVTKVGKD
jgi:hypothetical protein